MSLPLPAISISVLAQGTVVPPGYPHHPYWVPQAEGPVPPGCWTGGWRWVYLPAESWDETVVGWDNEGLCLSGC